MPKIVVVDDNKGTCELIETMLQLEGFQSDSVTQIVDSDIVAVLDEHKPDGLILDFHLQDRETLEYVEAIRHNETWKNLPVLMMSGINQQERCKQAGADTFVLKPFDWQELITAVRQIVTEKSKGGA